MPKAPDRGYLDDGNTRQAILTAIKRGGFTPFLGAGASSLRPDQLDFAATPWRQVRNALILMRNSFGLKSPRPDEAYLYLRSFAEQRLRLKPGELDKHFPIDDKYRPDWNACIHDTPVSEDWPSEHLLRFQCLLVRVAAELGKIFGHAFATSSSVFDLADCRIQVNTSEDSYKEKVVKGLLNLLEQTRDLRSDMAPAFDRRFRPPLLKVNDIEKKLSLLTHELTDSAIWSLPEFSSRKPKESTPTTSRPGEINLNRLQWLSDLLWYTLRYWIPRYPTTAELAFELSLAAEFGLPRRAELAQAAEALFWENKELAEALEPLLSFSECFSERADPVPTDFHLAVAAALQYMYLGYRDKRSTKSRTGQGRAFVPIALTTNFDRALEKTFDYFNLSYHVLYPLADPDREPQVCWYIKTVELPCVNIT